MNHISALDTCGVPWPYGVIDEDVEELVENLSMSTKETRYIPWEGTHEFNGNQMVESLLKMTQEPEDTSLDAAWDYKVQGGCKDYSQELISFDNHRPSSPCLDDTYDTFTNVQFSEVSISTVDLVGDSGDSGQSSSTGRSPSDGSGFTSPPSFHASDLTPRTHQKVLGGMTRTNCPVSWAFNGDSAEDDMAFGTEWLLAGDTRARCLGWTACLKVADNCIPYIPRIIAPQAVRENDPVPSWVNEI